MSQLIFKNSFKLFFSGLIFHISLLFNSIKYGNSFNFHKVFKDNLNNDNNSISPIFCKDDNGNIIEIYDGKKTLIILGSIPQNPKDILLLKYKFSLKESDPINIHSFNRPFEYDWSGLTNILKNENNINFYKYPTIDFCPPSFIDLLRIVRDLENRDLHNQKLSYVHCKAGRGRSATGIAAYILHLAKKVEFEITTGQVESYLKSIRPQVDLSSANKYALLEFKNKLNEAGSFEALYKANKQAVEKRDEEVSKINS